MLVVLCAMVAASLAANCCDDEQKGCFSSKCAEDCSYLPCQVIVL